MMRACGLGLVALTTVIVNAQDLKLPSPDGTLTLHQKTSDFGPQLWIENTRTHRQTKLFDIGGTVSAAWSADGSAFYVNDHLASDEERAYIYDAATLKRIDISARILAKDPESRRFASGHAYFQAKSWEGNNEVAVSFFGHTDEPPVKNFAFRYRISRSGMVQKLSQERFSR